MGRAPTVTRPDCHNVADGPSNFVSPASEGFTDPHEENRWSEFHNDYTLLSCGPRLPGTL